jgi:hypothetical protein
MLHHYDGDYTQSNDYCQRAEALSEKYSVDSVSENLAAIVTNGNVVSYAGLDFERALIYPIGMANYLGDDNPSEALVDARKLDVFVNTLERDKATQEEAFARYLSALIYESQGETDAALIDYRQAYLLYKELPGYKFSETFKQITSDYTRGLSALGMQNELRQVGLKDKAEIDSNPLARGFGELVIIFETGFAPYKATEYLRVLGSRDTEAVGIYKDRPPLIHSIRAKALDSGNVERSFEIYDSHRSAVVYEKSYLSEARGQNAIEPLLAYEFKKYGSRHRSIDPISREEKADVRSWVTLPGKIHLLRMTLPEGDHDIALRYFSFYGEEIFRQIRKDIHITSGRRTFINQKLP